MGYNLPPGCKTNDVDSTEPTHSATCRRHNRGMGRHDIDCICGADDEAEDDELPDVPAEVVARAKAIPFEKAFADHTQFMLSSVIELMKKERKP